MRMLHQIAIEIEKIFNFAGIVTDKRVMWEHPRMSGWALSSDRHIPMLMAFEEEPPALDEVQRRLVEVVCRQLGCAVEEIEITRTRTEKPYESADWVVIAAQGYRLQSRIIEMEITGKDWSGRQIFINVEKI